MKMNFKIDTLRSGVVIRNYFSGIVLILAGLLYSCSSSSDNGPAAPIITSFSPSEAVVGAEVSVIGRNFTGATAVDINGTNAVITSATSNIIKVNVPAGATTGKIKITTPIGSGVSVADFTVVIPQIPAISSFSPASAEVGQEVTVTGLFLDKSTGIKFNGTSGVIKSKTATTLKADLPEGSSTGKIEILYDGGSALSTTSLTVISTNPAITSFSPLTGEEDTEVTINGNFLDKVTGIKFNGVSADIKTKAADKIIVNVPAGATMGKISLSFSGGEISSADAFTVERQLQISDFEEVDSENTKWHVAQDGTEITVSEIVNTDASADGHYLHLKGGDTNGNYWLGGRYTENENSTKPFGVLETDATDVYFNVTIRSNNIDQTANQAKLVFAVYEAGQADNRRNWEIDFPVTWDTWKTISIRADKFHYWNGSGFTLFNGDVETMWSLALYITGGNATTSEFSFDNVVISEGKPLGEVQNP